MEIKQLISEKNKLEKMKISAEDKFFGDLISTNDYQAANSRYLKQIEDLNYKISILKDLDKGFEDKLDFTANFLTNLPQYFESSDAEIQKKLLGSIFTEKLVFDGNKYRTPFVNPAINILCNKNKGYRGKIKKADLQFEDQPHSVTCLGFEPRTPSLKGMCSAS